MADEKKSQQDEFEQAEVKQIEAAREQMFAGAKATFIVYTDEKGERKRVTLAEYDEMIARGEV